MPPIIDKSWLDPILPDDLPPSLIEAADTLPRKTSYLAGRLATETSKCLARLLRITNTYYSNLIEGQYTEPAQMQNALNAPRKERKQLTDLAVKHMEVQSLFERALRLRQTTDWPEMFDPGLISAIHYRLFKGTGDASLVLGNGSQMTPGELRSESGRNVIVGSHEAPIAEVVLPMLKHLQQGFGRVRDPRRRLIAALANHHRAAFVHPLDDGNGRVLRLLVHLQLTHLGLEPHLWSLSRGLARRHGDYYRALAMADRPREGDLDGRGQLSRKHYFAFIEFMLDVCHDQVDYMTAALEPSLIRERVLRGFRTNERLLKAGIRPETGPAYHALLLAGSLPRNDLKIFTGLGDRLSTTEVGRLVTAGLAISPTPRSRLLKIGVPSWFAQEIFPDLHRRFQ